MNELLLMKYTKELIKVTFSNKVLGLIPASHKTKLGAVVYICKFNIQENTIFKKLTI